MSEETIITRKTNFTVVDNGFINDSALSWKAKGILLYMMSKPANWKYNPKGDMLKRAKDGQDSLYAGIKELISAGYISRTKNKDGFLKYHIFEDKNDNKIADYLSQNGRAKPDRENPDQENPNQDNPDKENPDQENPDVLVNTDSSNTDNSNTKGSNTDAPKSARAKKPKFNVIDFLKNHNVSDLVIESFISHRKNKKAENTQVALNAFVREAGKAKITVERALEISIERNWAGFNASWKWQDDAITVGGKQSSHDLSKQDYSKDTPIIPQWMRELEEQGG